MPGAGVGACAANIGPVDSAGAGVGAPIHGVGVGGSGLGVAATTAAGIRGAVGVGSAVGAGAGVGGVTVGSGADGLVVSQT